MTTKDLAALSDAATQGEWIVEEGHIQRDSGGIRYWQVSDGSDAIACNQFCYAGYKPEVNEANAAFITALVNAYRAGQIAVIGPDAVATVVRELDRAIERIMGIEIEAMAGDNLAVLLCSQFDRDDDSEPDDNGWWSQSAIDAYDEIKREIAGLFVPVRAAIAAITGRV
jgi:hypothetical protein